MLTGKSDAVREVVGAVISIASVIFLAFCGPFGQALIAILVLHITPALAGIVRALLLRRRLLRRLREVKCNGK